VNLCLGTRKAALRIVFAVNVLVVSAEVAVIKYIGSVRSFGFSSLLLLSIPFVLLPYLVIGLAPKRLHFNRPTINEIYRAGRIAFSIGLLIMTGVIVFFLGTVFFDQYIRR